MTHTRGLQAVDPVPFPELGKADTRSGKGTGSTACEAAPGAVVAVDCDRRRGLRRAWFPPTAGTSSGAACRAVGSVSFRARVSAFPRARKDTEHAVIHRNVLLAFTADAIRARCRTGSGSGTAANKACVYASRG